MAKEEAFLFVPDRERQVQILVDVIPRLEQPHPIIDLACGEGLLAEAVLEQQLESTVDGLDGSAEMLPQAQERLKRFGQRFRPGVSTCLRDPGRKPVCLPRRW
jgi:trans-aconitate methyltransferase